MVPASGCIMNSSVAVRLFGSLLDHHSTSTALGTKPVIAQDVTLTWPKYIFKDKPASRSSLTSL